MSLKCLIGNRYYCIGFIYISNYPRVCNESKKGENVLNVVKLYRLWKLSSRLSNSVCVPSLS